MTLRALIYARVSTEEQTRGYSIDTQLQEDRRFCQQRGWQIVHEIVEPGVSGKTFARRPAWRQVRSLAETKDFDVLVCHRIDRFSRASVVDALITLRDLRQLGITFASATEPLDLTNPFGEVMLMMLLWFAREFLVKLSGVVTLGRRARVESGRSNANHAVFGYTRNADGIEEPDPATRETALAMFHRYATDRYGDADIARWLQSLGARTPSGRAFSQAIVRELLQNPFYVGYVTYRGMDPASGDIGERKQRSRRKRELIQGLHEPIVPADLFETCQRLRAKRGAGRSTQRRRIPGRVYLLAGLVHCTSCGARLQGGLHRGRDHRYWCAAKWRGGECANAGRMVLEKHLMPEIDRVVESLRVRPEIMARAAQIAAAPEARDRAAARRAELATLVKRNNVLYETGQRTEQEFRRRLAELQEELAQMAATAPPAEVTDRAGHALAGVADAWRAAAGDTTAERQARRDILIALVSRIDVNAEAKRIARWHPRADFDAVFRAAGVAVGE